MENVVCELLRLKYYDLDGIDDLKKQTGKCKLEKFDVFVIKTDYMIDYIIWRHRGVGFINNQSKAQSTRFNLKHT